MPSIVGGAHGPLDAHTGGSASTRRIEPTNSGAYVEPTLVNDAQMFLRLAVAVVVGALVGYERERAGKVAGVRTHGMVCLGAALFTVVSVHGFGSSGDPARVAAQIVTGIGFLGAGAILHQRNNVQGLTTAASLWVTAAIGLAVGTGMIIMSLATALLVFGLLRFGPRPGHRRGGDHHA